ncbi:RNA polymerase sigma factor [Pedobacter sp. ASV28]|uniref:RNA polymerase sigma factor n=1 Tax=Pedobacter sp. ASV28 TaxID=2795123 RepID=UPI0018EAA6A3|nr:RNA polymerase sigma-70 factor [Pedobacter sp. ASV28]
MKLTAATDERELLQKLIVGDGQAFDLLYRRYSGRILGNILKMVNDREIAKELLQDVFLKIWQKRSTINPEQSFRSYLFTVSKHLVYDYFRTGELEKKVQCYLTAVNTELYTHVEEELELKESSLLLKKAIDKLPPQRKQVFTLFKLEGKSYNEISEILGISTSTISDHLLKANRFIRAQILSVIVLSAFFKICDFSFLMTDNIHF